MSDDVVNRHLARDDLASRTSETFNVSDELLYGLRLADQPHNYPNLQDKIAMMVEIQATR